MLLAEPLQRFIMEAAGPEGGIVDGGHQLVGVQLGVVQVGSQVGGAVVDHAGETGLHRLHPGVQAEVTPDLVPWRPLGLLLLCGS
ncbi:hypothetical protein GDO81_028916 [Engystomops pustulosus]|uniref:Uncharacterized protein n=1 Tax=Engystomops pustulosus TaxID=76066 RepID=A0AAV6YNC2_ENGPU|nr:hypothetical protein GDO81_028916 [Engystomops pustulosus]